MKDFPESECTDDTTESILHFGCQTTEMAERMQRYFIITTLVQQIKFSFEEVFVACMQA